MNIRLMKNIDALAGRLAAALLPAPPAVRRFPAIKNILLIRPGGIGDAVHLIPLINALQAASPDIAIDILAEKRNCAVYKLCPNIRSVYHYDNPVELLRTLSTSYDVVIDTEQWHRLSAVVARLVRAPVKIGYGTNERARLFTHVVPYSHDDYEAESFLQLLIPIGIEVSSPVAPFLQVPDKTATVASDLLADVGGRPFVAIFPGASIVERRWGVERFSQVAAFLVSFGIGVVVVGGGEDRQQGEVIAAAGNCLNLAGRTSLAETAAVIANSALLLSGDSGLLHIAVGLDVPTVSLFGPGRARKWAPRGAKHVVINRELHCSPCTTFGTTPPCPYGARCMQEITVEEVCNSIMMLLTATGAIPSLCCKRDWIEAPVS